MGGRSAQTALVRIEQGDKRMVREQERSYWLEVSRSGKGGAGSQVFNNMVAMVGMDGRVVDGWEWTKRRKRR